METKAVDYKNATQVGATSKTFEMLVDSTNIDVPARDDSGWRDVRPNTFNSLEVTGIIGDTLKLYGTNKPNPQASDVGSQVGGDITANGIISITTPCAYLRLVHTVNGTGSVNAHLYSASS